uniref:Uncharacterized protein n=1 Tax=Peronospora matthiolae TaxID=2874970 RepID=A0AAV1VNA2_9STRA
MLTDPSDLLDASQTISTFKTRGLAGGADSLGSEDDLDLGGVNGIMAGIDPVEGGTLLDDPRRRNEERDPDKAARISSSEYSNGFVSKSYGAPAGSFWTRLFPVWEVDRFLPAVPLVVGVRADPDVAVNPFEPIDLEGRIETRVIPSDPEDLADSTGSADRGDSLADLALEVSTDSVPACVRFAVRGRLIGRPGSVDLDRLPVGTVAEAVDCTIGGRRSDPEAN